MLLTIFWCPPQKFPFHKARKLRLVMFFRWLFHERGSSLQVGSCLTPATSTCQRDTLWTPGALGASLLTLLKAKAGKT
jgi:hypothetical protein